LIEADILKGSNITARDGDADHLLLRPDETLASAPTSRDSGGGDIPGMVSEMKDEENASE